MNTKKILVTGGSGFVGRNVIQELLESRSDLAIYNYSRTPLSLTGVTDIIGDAGAFQPQELGEMQFDYIIHLLALSNDKYCADFEHAQRINIDFTKAMLEYARSQTHLKKFIHMSSIIVYDSGNVPPVRENGLLNFNYTNYSFTKGVAETYADFYRVKEEVPVIIFRLSNIYGPFQSFKDSPFLVPSKIMDALASKDITVFNTTPKRDWIYAPDAAQAIVRALDVDYTGTLNLASGKSTSVEEIVKEIATPLGVEYSSLGKETTGPLNFYCDISKIREVLGWNPATDLRTGMRETIRYIKEHAVV